MIVTTGARPSAIASLSRSASTASSNSFSLRRITLWPISSATSCAVSWSITWLIVAIAPIFIITLITSVALTDILLASSETTIVSPIATSDLATVADLSKPCCIEVGLASLPLPPRPRWLRPPRLLPG